VKNHTELTNFIIYYPANTSIDQYQGVSHEKSKSITLDVTKIDPEALIGLLQHITETGAMHFPDIFRYWQLKENHTGKFIEFLRYFQQGASNPTFQTLTIRGDISQITLHKGTYGNIERNLNAAITFFDNPDSKVLDHMDILFPGKLSVINVTGKLGTQFGSILLRDLLTKLSIPKRIN